MFVEVRISGEVFVCPTHCGLRGSCSGTGEGSGARSADHRIDNEDEQATVLDSEQFADAVKVKP
jgi:hypothetical protein